MDSHVHFSTGDEREEVLFLFAHHLCDGVSNGGTSLFDLFLGEANCDAHLQSSWDDLLRLEVILEGLEAGDEDAVCEALWNISMWCDRRKGLECALPRQQRLGARIAGRCTIASWKQSPRA